MNVYQFMSESPVLTFFLACIVAQAICNIWNRTFRHWNIRKHGYPPQHCDADGDFKEKK